MLIQILIPRDIIQEKLELKNQKILQERFHNSKLWNKYELKVISILMLIKSYVKFN